MFSIGCIQSLKCDKNTCPTGVTTHKKSLQRGLQPKEKSVKAAEYAKAMIKDVEMIAHSCGVPEPRALKRKHVRIVEADGRTRPLDEIMPYPQVETR